MRIGRGPGREAGLGLSLAADPFEHNNLSSDPAYAALMGREKLRLQAWTSFQNPFISRLASAPASDRY